MTDSPKITKSAKEEKREFFDSANIAESYSGIVLPLTCSFAKMVYERVYKDLLRMSGVSRKKIKRHLEIFENLLGFFYGRMYYNMNNWYRLAEFVPGYSRNKRNFELMITSNVKEEVDRMLKPSLALRFFYPIIVGAKVAVFGITAASFKSRVTRHLHDLRSQDFERLNYAESICIFGNISKNLLHRWYVTLENDFFVMTYLGILKKILSNDLLQKAITFESKATEQVGALATLSRRMNEVDELWRAIESDDITKFNTELARYPAIATDLNAYLEGFGGRFASELKLESVGVDEDPKKLFEVLRAYRHYEPKPETASLDFYLPFFKNLVVKVVVGKFRKYASRREEFRLMRSNTFAVARRLFRHMGVLMASSEVIDQVDDVFYLEMIEILDPLAEKNTHLRALIEKRKNPVYALYENFSAVPFWNR